MRRGGVQYYYLQDAEGNVRGLINTAGAVVASYDYSPQGELVGSTGSVTNPYRYKGREWDAEAGLYFMRARYYDPKVARFVSEDPIGVAGGMSLYAFGGGDPVNYSDPSGLAPCSEATISAGGWHSVELEPGDWWCLPVYTLQESRINGFGGRATSAFGFGRGVGAGIPYIPGSSGGSRGPGQGPLQKRPQSSEKLCGNDISQTAFNFVMHASGIGALKYGGAYLGYLRRVGSSIAPGVVDAVGRQLAMNAALLPPLAAMRAGGLDGRGGMQNPLTGGAGRLYAVAKFLPFSGLAIDSYEATTTCMAYWGFEL